MKASKVIALLLFLTIASAESNSANGVFAKSSQWTGVAMNAKVTNLEGVMSDALKSAVLECLSSNFKFCLIKSVQIGKVNDREVNARAIVHGTNAGVVGQTFGGVAKLVGAGFSTDRLALMAATFAALNIALEQCFEAGYADCAFEQMRIEDFSGTTVKGAATVLGMNR